MQIIIDTKHDLIDPDKHVQVAQAVATILANVSRRPFLSTDEKPGPQAPIGAVVESVVTGGPVAVTENTCVGVEAEAVAPPKEEKPAKRKRRTKKQIAADKRAAEADIVAKAAAAQMQETIETPAVKVVDENPVEAPAPVAPLPAVVTIDTVKQEVVDAIDRLNAKAKPVDPLSDEPAPPTATVQVVAVLQEVTGKPRVGEISADQYGAVLAALKNVGV